VLELVVSVTFLTVLVARLISLAALDGPVGPGGAKAQYYAPLEKQSPPSSPDATPTTRPLAREPPRAGSKACGRGFGARWAR